MRWTRWANRFVVIVSCLIHLPIATLILLGGLADGVLPIALIGVGATSYYAYLLVKQITSKVELTEHGVTLKTFSEESSILFEDIQTSSIEDWSGGSYMVSTWPFPTYVPVVYLKTGERIVLERAFGPKKRVVALLTLIDEGASEPGQS